MARKLNTGSRGGSLLSEGVYLLRVEDAEEKTSPSSGNDYLNIRFSVLKNGKPFGSSIWDIITYTENMEWRLSQLFDALEAPENEEVDPETWLIGKEVYAKIIEDDYNDEPRNKVKTYLLPKTAEKMLAKNAEAGESNGSLMAPANGTKAAGRGRTNKNQPQELEQAEAMPL